MRIFLGKIFFLLVLLALWSCGGPAKTQVSASVAVPFDLLKVASFQTQLSLNDPETGEAIAGPVDLTRDETNEIWTADMKGIDKSDYRAVVEIVADDPTGPLVIARAERDVSVNKGAPYATLTFKPSDFETSLDDDADRVSNLDEFLNGFNPHESDTDHDGVTDAVELAAIEGGTL